MSVLGHETRFGPELEGRILHAAARGPIKRRVNRFVEVFGAIAAAACLVFAVGWWLYRQWRVPLVNVVVQEIAKRKWTGPVSIENSLCTPAFVFERAGGMVLDSVDCKPLVIEKQIQISAVENNQFK
jgi:hypothetical protein